LQMFLRFLCGIVFGILAQITITPRFGDFLRHLRTAMEFQLPQLGLKLHHPLAGQVHLTVIILSHKSSINHKGTRQKEKPTSRWQRDGGYEKLVCKVDEKSVRRK